MHESESEVAQSCPTLSNPTDCSPPGSSIHGIFQARVLEWDAISFSDMEQQNGSNLEKEYIKVVYCHPAYLTVYCHPAYLTYMQIMSCRMSGWMNHKLESELLGEISTASDTQACD